MHNWHRAAPICPFCCRHHRGDLPGDLAGAYRSSGFALGKQRQNNGARNVDHFFRLRPDVMRSGFGGGFHSCGVTGRCRLVPRPMAPGRCRTKPDVSACSASAALAPPRIRLMRSRMRRASSKSSTLTAASILRCKSSIASVIPSKRAAARLSGIAPHLRSFRDARAVSKSCRSLRYAQRGLDSPIWSTTAGCRGISNRMPTAPSLCQTTLPANG